MILNYIQWWDSSSEECGVTYSLPLVSSALCLRVVVSVGLSSADQIDLFGNYSYSITIPEAVFTELYGVALCR